MAVDLDKYVQARRRKRKFIGILRWLAVVVLCLMLVFIEAGRFLRKATVEKIADIINTHVEVKSVNFKLNGSVDMKNLIITPGEPSKRQTVFSAEKIRIYFYKASLLKLKPKLQIILIDDFTVNACYDLKQASWNFETIRFSGKSGTGLKEVILKQGTLNFGTIDNNKVENITIIPFDAKFQSSDDGYEFKAATVAAEGFGQSSITGKWREGKFISNFEVSSAKVCIFNRQWDINDIRGEIALENSKTFSAKLIADNLLCKYEQLTEKLLLDELITDKKCAPYAALQKFFDRFRPLGKIGIELDVKGDLKQINKSSLSGKVFCKDVSVCYYKFPYLITELSGQIDLTEKSASFKDMKGCHGDVRLSFDGWSEGFGEDWKYGLRIKSVNMSLDDNLFNALNERNKKFWSDFSPTGKVTIDYTISREESQQAGNKKSSLIVGLLGVKARYKEFHYPLENITGMLAFDTKGTSLSNVTSRFNGREIIINGNVSTEDMEKPAADITVDFKNIPLDTVLAKALPEQQRKIYQKYDFKGLIDGKAKVVRRDNGAENNSYLVNRESYLEKRDTRYEIQEGTDFLADVCFRNTSLKMHPLSVSVANACGHVVITQDTNNLPWMIDINSFQGKYGQGEVSLEGKIATSGLCALSVDCNQIDLDSNIFEVLPEKLGTFAAESGLEGKINLNAFLTRDCPNCPVDINAFVQCLDNSMKPVIFPFAFTDIKGNLTITKEAVEFNDITAKVTDKYPETKEDTNEIGTGILSLLSGLFIDGTELRTNGLYDLDNGLKDGQFLLSAEDIKVEGHFFGNPDLSGKFSGQLCDGELVGEFEIADRGQGTGDMLNPINYTINSERSLYQLELGFSNVNLKKLLARQNRQDISGILDGSLEMSGQIDNSRSNTGRCKLQITDMQVGKTTPFGKLVSVLKLTEPQDYTFNEMFINSYIDGDKLTFEKFDLSGENIAFSGTGSMNLKDHNIDLILTVRGARLATADPSFFGSLGDSVGRAVLRMDVNGNIFDPQVQIKPLPVIKESLEILGTKRK